MGLNQALREELYASAPELEVRAEEPLGRHTSFRIGGPAEWMVFPKSAEELRTVLEVLHRRGVKPVILGAGTNVLAPDEGLRGVVIVLGTCLSGIRRTSDTRLEVLAGTPMAKAAMRACELGLQGLEFAYGIPGTVGGGVYMNAGAYGGEIARVAVRTEFLHLDGTAEVFEGAAQGFGYRKSVFQEKEGVILRTWLELAPGDREAIRKTMRALQEKRRASQPLNLPSAGSTFRRPAGGYAAALIEQAGLKGAGVGGAAVSEKHAGFVVNLGGATAEDVRKTVELIQERVHECSGIWLEPEVKFL